jgi:hypothetical protein
MSDSPSKAKIRLASFFKSIYDVIFVLLPALTWIIATLSIGASTESIEKLAAWPFAALSLYAATLKDGIAAFHLDADNDKRQRDIIVTVSIIGLVLSTVLLTLSIINSSNKSVVLFPYFYEVLSFTVGAGIILFFMTKNIFHQRIDFKHYV